MLAACYRDRIFLARSSSRRAIAVDEAKESQRLDTAFLLTLVPDPQELAATIRASEKGWLRAQPELNDPDRVWWRAQREHREWGIYVLRTLMD